MSRTRITICIGAGGVGKTTVASMLALHYAKMGEKTLVITVDPARRLLDALGIAGKAHVPEEVDLNLFADGNVKLKGRLFAFMPDLKREWMDFLVESIKGSTRRHEIANNPFYHYMVEGLPGSFEIICSHVLFRLLETGDFDRIVLDTPPSSHSVSFFDVPRKVRMVLEQKLVKTFLNQRNSFLLKVTKKLAFLSGGLLERTVERIVGSHFLSELIDFAFTIDGLYEPMLERVRAMESLFVDENTVYYQVLRPTFASVNDYFLLKDALKNRGITMDRVIMNQVMATFDEKDIENEIILLLKNTDDKANQVKIKNIYDIYRRQREQEKKLIRMVFNKDENINDVHLLRVSDAKNRHALLTDLLRDFQGNYSCAY